MDNEWLVFLQQHLVVSSLLVVLLGLCIGSFLNVIIFRYPRLLEREWRQECYRFLKLPEEPAKDKTNWHKSRSFCLHCQTPLKFWQLIPIISFCWQRGRCAHCQAKLSWQYPLVEFLTAITTWLVFIKFGFSPQTLAAWLLTWGLIVMSFIDLNEQILPDLLTLSLLWLGLFFSLLPLFVTESQAIVGAILGYGLLWLSAKLFQLVRRKQGMGHGDFKMLAMLGAWLGAMSLLNIILLAVILGLLINLSLLFAGKVTRDQPLPFGPSLAVAGWLTLMLGSFLSGPLMNWVFN